MDNKQKASSYAIAKVLGYEKSFDDFIIEYSQYYNEILEKLNADAQNGTVDAIQNPFRHTRF